MEEINEDDIKKMMDELNSETLNEEKIDDVEFNESLDELGKISNYYQRKLENSKKLIRTEKHN